MTRPHHVITRVNSETGNWQARCTACDWQAGERVDKTADELAAEHRNERCEDCGRLVPGDGSDTGHGHCGPLPHTGPPGGPYCERCAGPPEVVVMDVHDDDMLPGEYPYPSDEELPGHGGHDYCVHRGLRCGDGCPAEERAEEHCPDFPDCREERYVRDLATSLKAGESVGRWVSGCAACEALTNVNP